MKISPEVLDKMKKDLDSRVDAIVREMRAAVQRAIDQQVSDLYEAAKAEPFDATTALIQERDMLRTALAIAAPQLREYVNWHHEFAGGCSVDMEMACEACEEALLTPPTPIRQ